MRRARRENLPPGGPGGTPRPQYSTGPDGMATPGENNEHRPPLCIGSAYRGPPGAVLSRSSGGPRGITQGTGAGVGGARGRGGVRALPVPLPPALRLLLLVQVLAGHRVV